MAIVARRLRRASARVHVPRYALEAGYSRLTLYDDFTSIHSIDTTNSGAAGYTWYVKRPYGYPALAADEYVVEKFCPDHQSSQWLLCKLGARDDTSDDKAGV